MALISEADALRLLGNRVYDFREIMCAAWNDYLTYPTIHRRVHCATTRAGIVHDHIKYRVRERFDTDPICHIVELSKLLMVVIGQRLVVRFKMFHPDRTSSNIRTRQVEDYRMQRELPELRQQIDFLGELSHLETGYIVDRIALAVRETWLVCPSGIRENRWAYEIKGRTTSAGGPTSTIAPLRPGGTTTVRPKETTIVRIKRPQ